jgi:ATP-dependent protease HslVU (ClpYQ) peptidase subunit
MKSCPDMDAESVVNRVLDACDELDVYTGAPYHVESTGGKKVGKTVGLTVVSDD